MRETGEEMKEERVLLGPRRTSAINKTEQLSSSKKDAKMQNGTQ